MAIITPADRPKSVRNRCVIEVFGGVLCVVTLLFGFFCRCKGFCHRAESDLFLLSYWYFIHFATFNLIHRIRKQRTIQLKQTFNCQKKPSLKWSMWKRDNDLALYIFVASKTHFQAWISPIKFWKFGRSKKNQPMSCKSHPKAAVKMFFLEFEKKVVCNLFSFDFSSTSSTEQYGFLNLRRKTRPLWCGLWWLVGQWKWLQWGTDPKFKGMA